MMETIGVQNMTYLIIGAIVLIAIGFFFLKKKKEEEPREVKEEVSNVEKYEEELLGLNIIVRENINSKPLITSFEEVIDMVREILEPANNKDKFSDETILVNRMSGSYIPKILEGYFTLGNKEESEKRTLELLEKTKELLVSVKDSFEKDNKEGFERNARILDSILDSSTFKTKGENQ
jgi:LPXTG-motif cell wall-anchored protein